MCSLHNPLALFCWSGAKYWGLRRVFLLPPVGTFPAKANQMSSLTAKANWNIAKGKVKQLFARWTHDDQQFAEGKADELIGRIQKRAGADRRRIQSERAAHS